MFAKPHQLGFDPTMAPITQPDGSLQYDITVRSEAGDEQVYRTRKLLSSNVADRITGRGTCIWEVIRLEKGVEVGDSAVLKEAWVDEYRLREGNIIAQIRKCAVDDATKSDVQKVLLMVLTHGDVAVEGLRDCTRTMVLPDGDEHNGPVDDLKSPSISSRRQIHYRIVFKELCKPLREETSLKTVFGVLADASNGTSSFCTHLSLYEPKLGLLALHKCGWVHGDISVGNLLMYGTEVKIIDLEYTQRYSEIGEHDRIVRRWFT